MQALQLPMFDEPRARRRDPETSKQAALAAKELQAAHCDAILKALRKHGPLSKDGIAARTPLDGTQVARRTVELERAGLIEDSGEKALSTSGRWERVWRAL